MKNVFLALLVGTFLSANHVSARPLQTFSRNYTGKLGNKTEVVFSLKNSNSKLNGFYYYDKIGIEIKLSGEIKNGIATIYELDDQNAKRAKITGKLSQNGFRGTWENLSTKKILSLQFMSLDKAIPMFPINIIGNYRVDEQDQCALSISITKSRGEYFYHFKNLKRDLKGKITFNRSISENLVYINFHGIEWEEDSGDVTKDNDESSAADRVLPTVVQGLLSKGEILIQNTGNAMNRYVKISQCDLKYINLKRKE